LLQAFGAIEFADSIGKKLHFHINAGRIEMQGGPALNNLKGLFQQIHERGHQLINHTWAPREDFLKVCASMDIGVQVSFSETFNIVGADIVSQGVPLVGSSEIPWLPDWYSADPTNSEDIANKLYRVYKHPWVAVKASQVGLTAYTNKTARIWNKYFA
jgi:hypothetical protein